VDAGISTVMLTEACYSVNYQYLFSAKYVMLAAAVIIHDNHVM
jgi:hypothetical protein